MNAHVSIDVQQDDHFGGGSVIVWAEIHHANRTVLVNVGGALAGNIYRDKILQHHVIPHMNVNGGMFLQRHNI